MYSKNLAISTMTSETAKIYQYICGILSPIQTKLSEHVYNILLISLQSMIRHYLHRCSNTRKQFQMAIAFEQNFSAHEIIYRSRVSLTSSEPNFQKMFVVNYYMHQDAWYTLEIPNDRFPNDQIPNDCIPKTTFRIPR